MSTNTVLHAIEDASVNFVTTTGTGAFEARYVRRTDDYFIAYVSSQDGCDRACRFCHLTATGQTSMRQAGVADFIEQTFEVLRHHSSLEVRPARMNVNFMARGEPLLNPMLGNRFEWTAFRDEVRAKAIDHGVDDVRFNISTIMPTDGFSDSLVDVLKDGDATLYYSLYSMRPAFRRRWVPKSIDPVEALDILTRWQQKTGQEVALHWAFIEGQNDDVETIEEIIAAVRTSGLRPKFNAVRYNPFDDRRGQEPSEAVVERNFDMLAQAFGHPASRIVPRVGFSVNASCGMFVGIKSVMTGI